MKKYLAAATLAAMSTGAGPATSLELYSFTQDGWTENGVLSGRFVAQDFDENGQIDSFDGEVTDFIASYSSSAFEAPVQFTLGFGSNPEIEIDGEFFSDREIVFEGFSRLVFTLDGTGQLGDDETGAVEGLQIFSLTEGLNISVGPGPFQLCDGQNVCGGLFDNFGPFEETAQTFGEAPQQVSAFSVQSEQSIAEEFGAFAVTTNAISVTVEELDGQLETDPVFPGVINGDGGFVFDLDDIRFIPREIFFIDPEIAIGYTYEITGDTFFSVQAPSLGVVADGDGEYVLSYEQAGSMFEQILEAGDIFEFGPDGVSSFTITGIDPALRLSPTNTNAFVTGVAVTGLGQGGQITQTPITVNAVPLPASGVLLLSGIAGFAFLRRRREALRG